MAYLIKTVETYRVETEKEVESFLNQQKENPAFEVLKYSSTKKDIKEKGEIAETYYKVEITKAFCDEKYPCEQVEVSYERSDI